MKRTITRPDGTTEITEGTAEEFAALDRFALADVLGSLPPPTHSPWCGLNHAPDSGGRRCTCGLGPTFTLTTTADATPSVWSTFGTPKA